MPDSPSGVYTLPPSYRVANGDLTDATQHNPPLEDIQQALTNRIHRDGRTAWTGNQNANGNKLTALADGLDPQDAATVGQAAALVGDYKDTARTLDATWLRRDGSVYETDEYPDLGPLMEQVDGAVVFDPKTSGVVTALNKVAFGASKYIVGGAGGVLLSSTDKETWTPITSGTSEDITSVIYANSKFVATLGNGNIIESSSGGSGSWTERPTGAAFRAWDVAYGAGIWVVVGGGTSGSDGFIRSSPDLVTWTNRTPGTIGRLLSIEFGNSVFVGTGSDVIARTSSNGTTWSSNTIPGGEGELPYLNFANGFFFASQSGSTNVYRSTAGTAWTQISIGATPMSFQQVAYGDGAYLAVGTTGRVLRSIDANAWVLQTSGVSTTLSGIIYDATDEEFLIVGASGVIMSAVQLDSSLFRVPDDEPLVGWIKALP